MDKSTTYAVSGVLTLIAGITGYFLGRRNDAERTAAALLKQVEYAEQKEASEAAYTAQIEATAQAHKNAAESARQEAMRIAALTPDQRTAFEAEREHKEAAANARIAAQREADAAYAIAAAEQRQALAAEEMVRETRRLRREVSGLTYSTPSPSYYVNLYRRGY